jgi:hypothetical protein
LRHAGHDAVVISRSPGHRCVYGQRPRSGTIRR